LKLIDAAKWRNKIPKMSRNQNRLVSLAVLAMLTFALSSLQAQRAATNSAPEIAATNTNAPTRPISDAQFKKLLADNAKNGESALTLPIVAKAFGVDHPGESDRHETFQSPDKHNHTFCQLDNGNYMFNTLIPADDLIAYCYYADKNLVLISAASITKDGATIIPNKDAQAGLDAELKFFAGIADQL
jgi:hypothetical protein